MKQLTIAETLSRLESRGYVVKKHGDSYRSQCPAHKGKDLNLAFTLGKNGQVVFTCHSHNCTYEEIMASLGIEKEFVAEYFPNQTPHKKNAFGKTVHATLDGAISAATFGANQKRNPDKIYEYRNADSTENMFVCRWNTPVGKETRPITKTDTGYIVGTQTDKPYPIYRLPQLAAHLKTGTTTARLFICEGEKATEAAVSLGCHATCSPFGSKSAVKADWRILDTLATKHGVKLELVILPDNDAPGGQYGESLVDILTQFPSVSWVKVVNLADHTSITGIQTFPDGGDMFDLCEMLDSATADDIQKMLEKMVEATPQEVEIAEEQCESVYPWRPFPVDILPKTVSRFINEVASANGCDPAGVAIATLVVLAAAIGNSRRLRLKRGWVFPAILWGMLIARKGSIKTWALAPAVKPLDTRQAEYHEKYKVEKAEFDRKKKEYQRLSPAQRRLQSPPEDNPPSIQRIVSREATDQKIVKNCAENLRGCCIFSDELAMLLRGMGQFCNDKGGGNAQSIFNSLFNGECLESERVGSDTRYVPYPCVSIVGGIQPNMIKRCFDSEAFESGFASRFIPVAPPIKVATWTDAVVSEEVETAYCQLVFGLLNLEMEPVYAPSNVEFTEWNPDNNFTSIDIPTEAKSYRPVIIEVTEEAKLLYQEFYDTTASEMLELEDDNLRGTFEKLRTYAARFALVIHITRWMEQELFCTQKVFANVPPWDNSEFRIDGMNCDAVSMEIAIALTNWFKYEVRRVYATWGGLTDETPKPNVDSLQQRIVNFFEQRKTEAVSLRELQRRFSMDAGEMRSAVNTLTAIGILHQLAPPPGKRSPLFSLKSR